MKAATIIPAIQRSVLPPSWVVGTLPRPGGHRIRWATSQREPGLRQAWRFVIVFFNGRCEYIEKYAKFFNDLGLDETVGMITWDHRGQGASSGVRFHVDSYDAFCADAAAVLKALIPAPVPTFWLGHSMGCLISLHALGRGLLDQWRPREIILLSPFLDLPELPAPRFLVRALAVTATTCGLGTRPADSRPRPLPQEDFASNLLTTSQENFNRHLQSPYPGAAPTLGWLAATFRAIERVHGPGALAAQIHGLDRVSVLMGGLDLVVDAQAIRRWVERLNAFSPENIMKFKEFPGAKHELLSEADEFYQPTLAWICERVRATLPLPSVSYLPTEQAL